MKIKQLRTINKLELCKINKTIIGEIPIKFLTEEECKLDEIGTLNLQIPKYFQDNHTLKKTEVLIYDDLKNERFIKVNESDYYVIKEIKEDKINKVKTITTYSYEKKLEKNNIVLSDISLSLLDVDEENEIYSFNDELYKTTGWSLGYVDDTVRYDETGRPRVRVQENTDTSFYQFIKETIQEQFCCIADFDIKNKKVNLYDEDSFGDEIKIILNKDNYLKNLENTSNTTSLVTQLTLQGNEDKCIVEDANPNGTNYIEDYSYFVETEEMSKELINALNLYNKLTEKRIAEWRELNTQKSILLSDINNKTGNENILTSMVKEYENYIIAHENIEEEGMEYDLTDFKNQLQIKRDELVELNKELTDLEQQLNNVNNRIKELNGLILKETSKDGQGNFIFNDKLLDELKEFTYNDTYSEDSFIDANEILRTGRHLLESKCKPTVEYSIDVNDFTSRIISNKTKGEWQGELSLGDLIVLYDKETKKEEYVYFVGWNKKYNYQNDSNSITTELSLDLSNKKTNKTNTKVIADLLKDSKNNKKQINSTKHLLNDQKYNRFKSNLLNNEDILLDLDEPKLNDMTKVTGIDLNISTLTLDINVSKQIKAYVRPTTAKNTNVIWSSSDNNIASVSTTGLVKGINYGSCTITAITEEGNFKSVCQVTIQKSIENEVKVTGVQVLNSNIALDIGEEEYIIPNILPNNATNQDVTYVSSSPTIATVDNTGKITGVNYGICEIKVIPVDNPEISARCYISISTEDKKDYTTLNNALFIGDGRIAEMNNLGILNKLYVDAKADVDITYFNSRINTYPVNPTCIIVMPNINDLSDQGAFNVKTLLTTLKNKYPTKNIYLVTPLPVGVNYESSKLYSEVNNQITKFNSLIKDYANLLNVKSVNANLNLVTNGTLNSYYSKNGYYLTETGYRILCNNITNTILNYMNVKQDTPKDDDDDKKDDDNNSSGGLSKQRQLIIDRAKEIVKLGSQGKAWYSQYARTIDWNKKQIIKNEWETISYEGKKQTFHQTHLGAIGMDCSSFVGICYQNAGYNFMKGLSCAGGNLQSVAKKHGAKMWRYEDKGLEGALPGDIVMRVDSRYRLTKNNMATVRTAHTMIYLGDGYTAEAGGYSTGVFKSKKKMNNKYFFMRIEELTKTDKKSNDDSSESGSNDNSSSDNGSGKNCINQSGTIDGHKYIYRFAKARCTAYGDSSSTGAGGKLTIGKSCGAHNLPYSTKLFIPSTVGKFGNKDGIWEVKDTGGYTTDFDLLIAKSDSQAEKLLGNPLVTDVYVLEWGDGKTAWSFTEAIEWCNKYYGVGAFHTSWKTYMKYGGCTINFWRFKDHDKTIKSKSWYNKL
ncbi:MAG: Ig-like domain-containing protein [Clostridia bacterium]